MKKIKICHLYGNLLNTFGDVGNVMALAHEAHKKGYETSTEIISTGDEFNPKNYDFVLLSGGQDYEQKVVLEDIKRIKDDLVSYIENEGIFLAISGGFQILGKYYYDIYDKKIEGINIFNHYSTNKSGDKFDGPIKVKDNKTGDIYEGFESHRSLTYLSDNQQVFATVLEGNGNNGEDKNEGFIYKNTIATNIHGPLLAVNDNLCKSIISKIEESITMK